MTQLFSFLDDYSEGCHPDILEALATSNTTQQIAYGHDEYTINACQLIKQAIGSKRVNDVYFVASGTLANIITIASVLRPHEAVIASSIGHIVVRETGAIEATGHKLISIPTSDGKLTTDHIVNAIASNSHAPHMAKPRLVYVSNATELGTVYNKRELKALYACCRENNLLLMLDGARLGTALASKRSDLSLQDVAENTDIFWIGGTKAGALLGEAIIIPNSQLAEDFQFHIKQRGGLLAKGRLLGLQFETLFRQGLFFELSEYANQCANSLSEGIINAGYSLASETESNQVFAILPNTLIDQLKESFKFYTWEKVDDNRSVIRLVTSWATPESELLRFKEQLKQLS